jgi:pSer/pThr/pTyr-binding forkhead associated (FHA) protein
VGKLVLYMPDGSTREILLTRERIRIGRRPDNDIPLPFPAVSGEHAAIVTILSDSFLEDLGSTNGTFVNGKPVTKHFLRDRDRIDVGRENFIYYADDAAKPEPLPSELLNSRNLAQPLESYRSIEADIAAQIAVRAKRTTKGKRVPVDAASSPVFADDSSDRTTRLKTGLGVSAPVPPLSRDAPSAGESIDTQIDDDDAARADFVVRVMTGPSAGRELPLSKGEQSVGRIGVTVVTLKRNGDEIWLIPVEGTEGPRRNGSTVPTEGVPLAPGDTFEVAGAELTIARR